MKLIDTHAHLYDFSYVKGDSEGAMIDRARAEGVRCVYMPNLNIETLPCMFALEERYPNFCRSMLGLHPCDVGSDFEVKLEEMEGWLGRHSFAAIGEVGLDLYHSCVYEREQVMAFKRQVGWARSYGLPLVIHCRGAFDLLLELLTVLQDGELRGIIHCFTGTLVEAKRCMALGFYLGIGGILTYKNAGLADVVREIPLDHLVLETDSPYLSPVPYRGRRNEPSYLPYIAGTLAEVKGVGVAEVAEVTTGNALRCFGV